MVTLSGRRKRRSTVKENGKMKQGAKGYFFPTGRRGRAGCSVPQDTSLAVIWEQEERNAHSPTLTLKAVAGSETKPTAWSEATSSSWPERTGIC